MAVNQKEKDTKGEQWEKRLQDMEERFIKKIREMSISKPPSNLINSRDDFKRNYRDLVCFRCKQLGYIRRNCKKRISRDSQDEMKDKKVPKLEEKSNET